MARVTITSASSSAKRVRRCFPRAWARSSSAVTANTDGTHELCPPPRTPQRRDRAASSLAGRDKATTASEAVNPQSGADAAADAVGQHNGAEVSKVPQLGQRPRHGQAELGARPEPGVLARTPLHNDVRCLV